MTAERNPLGRREQAKAAKRNRIVAAARALFAEHGVEGVTTQQVADRADIAVGTLFLYAATKAELLIMVQNQKFAAAIDEGLTAAEHTDGGGAAEAVFALVRPVVACIREQPENGRAYLRELMFGDPAEPHRAEGLILAGRLEDGVARTLTRDPRIPRSDAATLARVVTSIIHVTTAATVHLQEPLPRILELIRHQVDAVLSPRAPT